MSKISPYVVLGVAPGATEEVIRSAWRKRSLDCHPDKRPGDPAACVKFAALTHARDCLLDPAWYSGRLAQTSNMKKRKMYNGSCWGSSDGHKEWCTADSHHFPIDAVTAARKAAAVANKRVLESTPATFTERREQTTIRHVDRLDMPQASAANSSRTMKTSTTNLDRAPQSSTHGRQKFGRESDVAGWESRRELIEGARAGCRKVRHPNRLVSFAASESDRDETGSDSSVESDSGCTDEVSLLDTVFSHALNSWQASSLNEAATASKRFMYLMPAKRLRDLRPHQQHSVLFAYDYCSKVLYEYIPDDNACAVVWTPSDPTENAAIWIVLPLPPAWLRAYPSDGFEAPGSYCLTLPAGCLNAVWPGHTDPICFSYDPKEKVLYEFVPTESSFKIIWTPAEPTTNVMIWTVLPLPPDSLSPHE